MDLNINEFRDSKANEETLLRRRANALRLKMLSAAPTNLTKFVEKLELAISDLINNGRSFCMLRTKDLEDSGFENYQALLKELPALERSWNDEVAIVTSVSGDMITLDFALSK